jgi:putative peptidoglycan lipid II flippase
VEGLALGHATAYTFAAVTALLVLRRKTGGLDGRRLGIAVGKIGTAGVATGATAYLVSRVSQEAFGTATLVPQLLQVGGGLVAGAAVFIAVAAAFRLPELRLLRELVGTRMRRG